MDQVEKKYTHYKDFKSHKVEINGVDISAIVMEFEIYQDIFSAFWSASMIISDTQNEMMLNEWMQGDRVNIRIEGKQGPATFKFIIHQISDRQLIKQQHYGYSVQMIDEGFFKDQKERISKSFKNKKADQAIGEILSKVGGVKEKSTTEGKFSFIIPNLSPIAAAQWLAKWAVANKSGAADILTFQSGPTTWNWLSVEEMLEKKRSEKLIKLVQRPANLLDEKGTELPEYEYAIEQYKFINHMNAIPNTVMGAFANTSIKHDLKTRKASISEFKYGQDIPKDGSKKPYKNLDGLELANVTYQAVHPNNIDDGSQGFEEDFENWKGSRKSSVQKLDTNRLLVQIPGRIDIHTELGKYTRIDLPSQQDKEPAQLLDKHFKERWLITAFRHVWTQKSFITYIELGKKRLA